MTQNAQIISLIAGVIVPILVGLIAKAAAPAGLKAVLNAALSGVGGLLTAANLPGGFGWKGFAIAWAQTWVVSIATYYGLYVHTGVTAAVTNLTANIGIGSSQQKAA